MMSVVPPNDLSRKWDDHDDLNNHIAINSSAYFSLTEFNDMIPNLNVNSYLSVFNSNAGSLAFNHGEYRNLFDVIYDATSFQFDIISFCESWLDSSLENLVSLHNYSPMFKHKVNKKEYGGLCMFIKSSLSFKIRDDLKIPSHYQEIFDALFVEILMKNSSNNYIIGLFYRSPSHSEKDFLWVLKDLLDSR